MKCTAELIDINDKRLSVENANFHPEVLGVNTGADGGVGRFVESAAKVVVPSESIETIKGFKPIHIVIKTAIARDVRWTVSDSWPGPAGEFRLTR